MRRCVGELLRQHAARAKGLLERRINEEVCRGAAALACCSGCRNGVLQIKHGWSGALMRRSAQDAEAACCMQHAAALAAADRD